MSKISRRDFIKKVGIYGAVSGVATAAGMSIVDIENAKATQAEHPFGYPVDGLDVEVIRRKGYDGYKGIDINGITHAHCAFGAFHAIISQLAEVVGSPYDTIPTQMMEWASGGVTGFATFCGALNGACAAIGLICSNSDAKDFISDLLSWYAETSLPTNLIEPTGYITQSVAGGNLCHTSVTNWCLASGHASGSSERSERCARITGDVAAMAVTMLNDGRLGLMVPGDKTICRTCHYRGTDYEGGQFTRGKMDCTKCHVDLKKVSESGHHKGRKK